MAVNLAEQICNHCATPESESPDGVGFGALLGFSKPLREIVQRWFGQRIEITDGVAIGIPVGCEWETRDLEDGSVLIAFRNPPPRLTAKHSFLRVSPELTAIVVRLGADAIEINASLRSFPDFAVTLPLRGSADK